MSFIRSLECPMFLGITNRLERDIASKINASGNMPTQENWNQLRELREELSNIQKLIREHNFLTEAIAQKERDISHMEWIDPETTISLKSLQQNQARLKEVTAKLSDIYKRELGLTKVDLKFILTKMNAHIWALEQSYPQPDQKTIEIIDMYKQKRQAMKDEYQFIEQKLRKD